MAICQFCDQRNAPGRRHCEKCGAELPLDPSAAPPEDAEPPHGFEAEIVELLRTQGKIAAIKRYREATGLGLAEAKYAVERLEGVHKVKPASGTGCATVLAALIAMASLAASGLIAGLGKWPW